MYSLVLSEEIFGQVIPLTVRGICGVNTEIIWGTPVEYMLAKYFADTLNEHNLPEDELFDATHEFLIAVQ